MQDDPSFNLHHFNQLTENIDVATEEKELLKNVWYIYRNKDTILINSSQ